MLHYLSVHDFVWINSTVLGRTAPFDYEKLEASMAAQYGYLESGNAPAQAANLLKTMLSTCPFKSGSARTAFIATLVFMTANKFTLQAPDAEAADLVKKTAAGEISAADTISALFKPSDLELREGATLRALVTHICNEHTEALRLLADGDE
jgi:prophage maintenance system killer protein